ncbi:MAG TPA: AraC family transcriptional regulator [Clostridiaceae bacterium]
MLEALSKTNLIPHCEEPDYVQLGIEFIEANYNRSISVEDMAKAAKISMFHFSRLFKRTTGYTPHEFLVKYKLNKSKGMLINSHISIDQIAQSVGFQDVSSFIRDFKKYEELTPLKYRNHFLIEPSKLT